MCEGGKQRQRNEGPNNENMIKGRKGEKKRERERKAKIDRKIDE